MRPPIISRLLAETWQDGVVMNLNFPARAPEEVTEVEVTRQGFREAGEMHAVKRTDLRGRDYYWMSFRGTQDRTTRRAPTCGPWTTARSRSRRCTST